MVNKILVSQPAPTSDKSPYFEIKEKFGVDIIFRPFIKVEGLTSKEFRQQRINLEDYNAVIFTARAGVDSYFRLCEEARIPISSETKYFCTTEAIALYLQKYIVYRKRKIFFGLSGKLDDAQLTQALTKNAKAKFLLPVSDVHKDDNSQLDKLGLNYTKAVMYRTVSNDFSAEEAFDYDMLIFFTPAGIASLLKNFPNFKENYPNVKIGCFGAATAKAVTDAGLNLDLQAPNPQSPSMTGALENYLKNQK
jgi:uroporphyrinogen-III synthase